MATYCLDGPIQPAKLSLPWTCHASAERRALTEKGARRREAMDAVNDVRKPISILIAWRRAWSQDWRWLSAHTRR
jgi:hypothetical protein